MRLRSTSVSQVEQIAILNWMGLGPSVDGWVRRNRVTPQSLRGVGCSCFSGLNNYSLGQHY